MRLVASLGATFAVAMPSPVEAETGVWDYGVDTGPSCPAAYVVPFEGSTLPANVPALAFEGRSSALPSLPVVEDVLLRTDAGTVIPTTLEPDPVAKTFTLVRISSPLVEGTVYFLRWTEVCGSGDAGISAGKLRSFKAGAAVPKIPSIGELSADVSWPPSVELTAKFSPEARAFLPVTMFAFQTSSSPVAWRYRYGLVSTDTYSMLEDFCAGASGPRPGYGYVFAHVAGMATDPPPLTTPFSLTCPSPYPPPRDGSVEPDTTAPPNTSIEPTRDMGTADSRDPDAAASDVTVRAGCGCRVGADGDDAAGASMVMAALIAVRARRRRPDVGARARPSRR